MGGQHKRFSDFADEDLCMDGEKVKIKDIVDVEVLVTAYRITTSKYKKSNAEQCLMIQFLHNEKRRVCFTGSTILMEQIKKYQDEIPFLTKIRAVDKYYTFS